MSQGYPLMIIILPKTSRMGIKIFFYQDKRSAELQILASSAGRRAHEGRRLIFAPEQGEVLSSGTISHRLIVYSTRKPFTFVAIEAPGGKRNLAGPLAFIVD